MTSPKANGNSGNNYGNNNKQNQRSKAPPFSSLRVGDPKIGVMIRPNGDQKTYDEIQEEMDALNQELDEMDLDSYEDVNLEGEIMDGLNPGLNVDAQGSSQN